MLDKLYNDLIELRNRLRNDPEPTIYEEDALLLDDVLDYIEQQLKGEQNNA